MKGIQYIVDETGEKTAVVNEFYQNLLDRSPVNEDWLNRSPFREKLDQVLTWNANHPPQLSYLESLESKLENNEC
jgi:predicted transglutaminase-like protease